MRTVGRVDAGAQKATQQEGSTLPVTVFLFAAIASPYVFFQSSLAVFTLVLGINPRGAAERVGPPWNEVFTIVLTVVLAASFLVLLTKTARTVPIGWVGPGIVVVVVVLGALVAGFLASAGTGYFAEVASIDVWARAEEMLSTTVLVGTVLVAAMLMVSPLASRFASTPRWWIYVLHATLAGLVLAYGVVPAWWSLMLFG